MLAEQIIVMCAVIAVGMQASVEGLQCYVCEDCNEFEDYKELQICGELPVMTTTSIPSVTTEASVALTTLSAAPAAAVGTVVSSGAVTVKPVKPPSDDDYNYDYSMETGGGTGGAKANQTRTIVTTQSAVPFVVAEINSTSNIIAITTPLTTAKTTAKPSTAKPAQSLPHDYDYMEYEDPKIVNLENDGGERQAPFRFKEPVCYMIKYHANNTIYTNRGCTNSINGNKYLTCHSLYQGMPISNCRICGTDGCNKYELDDSSEETFFNGAHIKTISYSALHLTLMSLTMMIL